MPARPSAPAPSPPLIGRTALNRAFLARQLLLERHAMSALDAVGRLVGLQAQAPTPPYYGLWGRLVDFTPEQLSGPLGDRRAVRITLMRGTVHLVGAQDCRALRPWVQPFLERFAEDVHGRDLPGVDRAELVAEARGALAERPRTAAELGELLRDRWPQSPAAALATVARTLLPLVQIPPRGLWGRSGGTTYATAEDWLGGPLDSVPDPEALVLRYLAAFGPATVKDIQTWSGVTRLRAVAERLRPRLVALRDEAGNELLDLPGAPRPGPDVPAPVRLLAPYDNAILAHADRTRIISDAHRRAIATKNGVIPGTVLVGGFVRGAWRLAADRTGTTLEVRLFAPVTRRERAGLAEEGERLLSFATHGSPGGARALRVTDA
ncbi:winged helix DNA-binding domain-containing protein [Streptomyces sp. NBC_01497]|uniref:winged helix DNA-binding domain-containing protein n=1 Tax=Streptomyces sp. NBC_01497 TaxID=2903885 RepID=UPI002E31392C|nr:winged helix DNA-binding domain-containing protein [Streptomyces sp. NBC_01497]